LVAFACSSSVFACWGASTVEDLLDMQSFYFNIRRCQTWQPMGQGGNITK
jgi:hypothetical protein